MNRRSFLQSLSAAFAVSMTGIHFRPVQRIINYDLFTCRYTTRYDFAEPFGLDGTVYATDARVLIAHAGELQASDDQRRLPKLSHLEWDEFDSPGFKSLGAPVYRQYRESKFTRGTSCPDCMGTGKIGNVRRCSCPPYSEWIDEDVVDGPQVIEGCEICRGGWLGDRSCQRCKQGFIHVESFREIVNDMPFAPSLMARVRTLGSLDVKVVNSEMHDGPMMLFRGENNLRGMLMGMV